MLFNSLQFIYFLPVALLLFFIVPQKWKWLVLLVLSYYFYMCWKATYVVLILFTTVISYWTALKIERAKSQRQRKGYLAFCVISSLSVLFFYKYFNLLGNTISALFGLAGSPVHIPHLDFLLPVGISFYTFETLSYAIDVYRRDLKAEPHFGIYALFVSFYPKLIAGPIERSRNLLPQFRQAYPLLLDNFIKGFKYIIIGFFMKLVVADRLALYVDAVFNNISQHYGITLLIASCCFSFQILCDFAGYSTIAWGVAKCMGFDLTVNFRRPYFATSMTDFWRRWHVSLSTWFRDYFYIPIGGNRVAVSRKYFNLFITFLVSGLWHGANWTFAVWGALHGLLLVIENLLGLNKKNPKGFMRIISSLLVFILATLAWVFFRANNLNDTVIFFKHLPILSKPVFLDKTVLFYGVIGVILLLCIDLWIEKKPDGFLVNSKIDVKTILVFSVLVIITFLTGVFDGGQFIYFQF